MHHYKTNSNGPVTEANIIVGTTNYHAPISMGIKRATQNSAIRSWAMMRQGFSRQLSAMYGTMYGMRKTTLYLPDSLKLRIGRLAKLNGTSEAELIREALTLFVAQKDLPAPRLPLFTSDNPGLAERVDEALEGFGER